MKPGLHLMTHSMRSLNDYRICGGGTNSQKSAFNSMNFIHWSPLITPAWNLGFIWWLYCNDSFNEVIECLPHLWRRYKFSKVGFVLEPMSNRFILKAKKSQTLALFNDYVEFGEMVISVAEVEILISCLVLYSISWKFVVEVTNSETFALFDDYIPIGEAASFAAEVEILKSWLCTIFNNLKICSEGYKFSNLFFVRWLYSNWGGGKFCGGGRNSQKLARYSIDCMYWLCYLRLRNFCVDAEQMLKTHDSARSRLFLCVW